MPVEVTFCCHNFGELPVPVIYAGGASGSVAGLLQVNVQIPPDLWLNDALWLNHVSDEGAVYVEIYINDRTSGFGTFVFIRDVPSIPGPNDPCLGCWDY